MKVSAVIAVTLFLGISGCLSGDSASAMNNVDAGRPFYLKPIHWQGQTALGVGYLEIPVGERDQAAFQANLTKNGNDIVSFRFTMTWDADSVLSEELLVLVDKTHTWTFDPNERLEFRGSSPLVVFGETSRMGNGPLALWVRPVSREPIGQLHVEPSIWQSFFIDGYIAYVKS